MRTCTQSHTTGIQSVPFTKPPSLMTAKIFSQR